MHSLAVFALRVEFGVVPGVALGGWAAARQVRGGKRPPGTLVKGCLRVFGLSSGHLRNKILEESEENP